MFPSISCFVPVYNEARTVRNNIEIIYQNLARLKEPFEIFIVDDASTDTTPQICQKMARKLKTPFVTYTMTWVLRKERIYQGDYFLRTIFLDEGKHTVRFVYFPRSFKIGLSVTLSALGLVVLSLLEILLRFYFRKL